MEKDPNEHPIDPTQNDPSSTPDDFQRIDNEPLDPFGEASDPLTGPETPRFDPTGQDLFGDVHTKPKNKRLLPFLITFFIVLVLLLSFKAFYFKIEEHFDNEMNAWGDLLSTDEGDVPHVNTTEGAEGRIRYKYAQRSEEPKTSFTAEDQQKMDTIPLEELWRLKDLFGDMATVDVDLDADMFLIIPTHPSFLDDLKQKRTAASPTAWNEFAEDVRVFSEGITHYPIVVVDPENPDSPLIAADRGDLIISAR